MSCVIKYTQPETLKRKSHMCVRLVECQSLREQDINKFQRKKLKLKMEKLSRELLVKIFEFLLMDDLENVSKVCKL